MNVTPELINRVVHDVLQTLQQRGGHGLSAGVSSAVNTPPPPTSSPPQPPASSSLDLTAHTVITEDVIADGWSSQSSLSVGPDAIITPSAQDFIRRHGLNLHRASLATVQESAVGWLLMGRPEFGHGVQSTSIDLPAGWSQSVGATLKENITSCATTISRAEVLGAIIPSSRPHAAVCLANRHSRLRAGLVHTAADVSELSSELGANLYVVDDRQLTRFGLLNIVRAIGRQPAPAAPAGWKE